MNIPIQNIYYLLCYAWNKLEEKERLSVSFDDKTEVLDLLSKVLISATRVLLKRGIDKSYVDFTEEINGVKGKLRFAETLKANLLLKQRTVCTYDDFSSDILSNRILVTTLYKLSRTKGLDKNLKSEIQTLYPMFPGITKIELKRSHFRSVKIHRNNRFYEFILKVCELIFENTLPSEEKGVYKFSDFTRDDRKMNQLFEAFIRNFYKREQNKYQVVKKEIIEWKFKEVSKGSNKYLPTMETDVTLENDSEKIVMDAKFYRETLASYYDKERIKSENLYQLFSYLLNQEAGSSKTFKAKGILVYPTIDDEYDFDFSYKEHPVEIRTLNLNANWRKIESRLKSFI